MSFLSEYIKELRKQYKQEKARKVVVKLLCNSKMVRKGNIKNG